MTADILDGVTANSSRAVLYGKLREAARQLFERADKQVAELQEIEERVRAKYANRNEALVQIIATSTESEWGDAVDFLENFKDMLPVALYRVHDGAKTALGRQDDEVGDANKADQGGDTP